MCRVNFLHEFNLIMRYCKQYGLSPRERTLWIALLYIANDRAVYDERIGAYDWPDDYFVVSNRELELESSLDKRNLLAIRNSLKQRGLIDFRAGTRNTRNPEYKLIYRSLNVGCKTVPNDVPNSVPNNVPNSVPNNVPNSVPNNVPNSVPNISPYYKYNINKEKVDYQKKLGIDNAYRTSERARSKTAQLICDELDALGWMPAQDGLHEIVAMGLQMGFTPNSIMRVGWDNHGDKCGFAAGICGMRPEMIEQMNRVTAEGI